MWNTCKLIHFTGGLRKHRNFSEIHCVINYTQHFNQQHNMITYKPKNTINSHLLFQYFMKIMLNFTIKPPINSVTNWNWKYNLIEGFYIKSHYWNFSWKLYSIGSQRIHFPSSLLSNHIFKNILWPVIH